MMTRTRISVLLKVGCLYNKLLFPAKQEKSFQEQFHTHAWRNPTGNGYPVV